MSKSKPTRLTPLTAAFAGALGGCFSNAIVYPLDVAKTRIQAARDIKGHEDKISMAAVLLRVFREEGVAGLYKGFGATMLNTFSMQYAYFFFYSFVRGSYLKRLARKLPPGSKAPALSTAAELLLGALAGALAQLCTIPVAVIATRQQIGRAIEHPKRQRPSRPSSRLDDIEKSETASTISEFSVDDEEPYDDSFFGVAREIIEEEGYSGLWLGIKPGLVLTVNPAITYGVYERVKNMVLAAREKASEGVAGSQKLGPWMTFVVGALSKSLATVVTYPYIMAKVRIQARTADEEDAVEQHHSRPHRHEYHHDKHRHAGALDILARVWRKEGLLGWYQGMEAQITKAVISQALLFLSKEQFEHWTLALVVAIWQLRRRT